MIYEALSFLRRAHTQQKKYLGNLTDPSPYAEEFVLCFTNANPEQFELDCALVFFSIAHTFQKSTYSTL